MKLVIAISTGSSAPFHSLPAMAAALAALRDDGHSLLLATASLADGSGNVCCGARPLSAAIEERQLNLPSDGPVPNFRRALGAALARRRLVAIPLDPSDGEVIRVRQTPSATGGFRLHPVSSNPVWLQIIAAHGGIPLLSNAFYTHLGENCDMDVNMMAAVCARDWKADCLLLFSGTEESAMGIRNGTKWLNAEEVPAIVAQTALGNDLRSQLLASVTALEGGVPRVRLMPLMCFPLIENMFVRALGVGIEVVGNQAAHLRRLALS